jgi:hypothetical protein
VALRSQLIGFGAEVFVFAAGALGCFLSGLELLLQLALTLFGRRPFRVQNGVLLVQIRKLRLKRLTVLPKLAPLRQGLIELVLQGHHLLGAFDQPGLQVAGLLLVRDQVNVRFLKLLLRGRLAFGPQRQLVAKLLEMVLQGRETLSEIRNPKS